MTYFAVYKQSTDAGFVHHDSTYMNSGEAESRAAYLRALGWAAWVEVNEYDHLRRPIHENSSPR